MTQAPTVMADAARPAQRSVAALGIAILLGGVAWLGAESWQRAALLVVGGLLGITLYHTAFGFTAAYRRAVLERDVSGVSAPRARRLGGERAAADARGRDAAVRAHPGAGGGVRARRRRGGGARRRPSGGGELPVRARHAARRRLRLRLGDPLYGGWRQPTHGGDASCFLRRRVLGQPRHGFLGPDPEPAQHFAGRVLGLGGSAARSARRACPDLDRAARLRPRRACGMAGSAGGGSWPGRGRCCSARRCWPSSTG